MANVLEFRRDLEYRQGVPDEQGYWWLLSDDDFLKKTNGFLLPGPQIVRVLRQSDITGPELYMQGRNGRLETWLFTGMVAGPIPEPRMR